MNLLSVNVAFGLAVILFAGCGGSSHSNSGGTAGAGEGARAGTSGGEAGTVANAGRGASSGRGGSSSNAGSGTGGTSTGSGGSGGDFAGGGAGTGATGTGGAQAGSASVGGAAGGSATGGVAGGAGTGGSSAGGSSAGGSSGGTSGSGASGEGGNGGERAIECMGATQFFPEFDKACVTDADCVAVAHQTNCCGTESVTGIRASEQTAFDAAEATCKKQYPACGCAAQGVDVEDGTQVGFSWRDQVKATCDAGLCKAHYTGTSFECGTRRCTEQQYCVESSGGPVGTPTSYGCSPTGCTDCSCTALPDCTCSEADGHLTFTCQHA